MMLQDNIPTVAMRCDHSDLICLSEVRRAPVIVVPGKAPFDKIQAPRFRPIRIPTDLHYCEFHRGDFDVHQYLSDVQKARIEATARQIRSVEWKPDFDAAFADLVLVTTPEYRRFLVHIGVVRAA
jgi:hypothetical protein